MSNKRPDFFVEDVHSRVLVIGEEKSNAQNHEVAVEELKDKNYVLNKQQHNNLKYSFAYAVTGTKFSLFLNDHSSNDSNNAFDLIKTYDLKSWHDRLQLTINTMCIVEICNRLSEKQAPTNNFLNSFLPEITIDGNLTIIFLTKKI